MNKEGFNCIRWPHAPPHWKLGPGTFFVTAGTFGKEHYFGARPRLRFLTDLLLESAEELNWELEAWSVFSNHYHFVGKSDSGSADLSYLLKRIHGRSARWVNLRDGVRGRKVWHNFWDTRLTFEKSYYARLAYVHGNAVKHGLVKCADQYPWCSAAWFEKNATPSQVATIYGFKTDCVNVDDDFRVKGAGEE